MGNQLKTNKAIQSNTMRLTKLLEIKERKQGRRPATQMMGLLICLTVLAQHGPPVVAAASTKQSKVIDGPVIGIDLGTTYSAVGIYKNGRTEMIPNELGNRITPSVVGFTDEERLVGEAAKNQMTTNPKGTVNVVKRLIGRKFDDAEVKKDIEYLPYDVVSKAGKPYPKVGDKIMSPEEISAMILTKMKHVAENYLGEDVNHAVITVPAYFNDA